MYPAADDAVVLDLGLGLRGARSLGGRVTPTIPPPQAADDLPVSAGEANFAVKLGKEWRFRKSILDRWLDDQIDGAE
jgi:hypothetical protein